MTTNTFLRALHAHTDRLTRQQIKTLRGQTLAGNMDSAVKGLNKILRRYDHDESRARDAES